MMRHLLLIELTLFIAGFCNVSAQTDQPSSLHKGHTLYHHARPGEIAQSGFFNPDWAPFYHGVASGDPMEDRVIIWTRVTPDSLTTGPVEVTYRVATDPLLSDVVVTDTISTDASKDYTVKVDVLGLSPGNTYYYGFTALEANSLTGKTKTTPTGDQADQLKFGVVSCSNYQAGYFNAYQSLADMTDLDAIIHLGDYIYEYANFVYGSDSIWDDRILEPNGEIVTLEDYRSRYSTYRLDTNLIRLHQQHPMIAVWDDHESANDSYVDGAENHQDSTQGSWEERKSVSKQVYFEWLPIRDEEENDIFRTISYGDITDLIMLDTRLKGRDEQILDITNPALYDPNRTLLGQEQLNWLQDQLINSSAKWKIIGQQIIFSEFNVGWAGPSTGQSFEATESIFLDIWDGYPAERIKIAEFIRQASIDNVVILSGDFHSSFANEVAVPPVRLEFRDVGGGTILPFYLDTSVYDPATGQGAVALEFVTPSITSANFDENVDPVVAAGLEFQINNPIVQGPINLGNPNPHMKFADLDRHGFFILDIQDDKVQADYYYTSILEPGQSAEFGKGLSSLDEQTLLTDAPDPSAPKAVQDIPAPPDPPQFSNTSMREKPDDLTVFSIYPNPSSDYVNLHFALRSSSKVRIALIDSNGRQIKELMNGTFPGGPYSIKVDVSDLTNGLYLVRLQSEGGVQTQTFVKQ